MANIIRTIPEPNKTVNVIRECDVVVVGGGPGGIGAAVSAATRLRHGIERPGRAAGARRHRAKAAVSLRPMAAGSRAVA